MIFERISVPSVLHKTLCCGCSLELPHPQHTVGFYEEISKIIFELSSNTHLICSAAEIFINDNITNLVIIS